MDGRHKPGYDGNNMAKVKTSKPPGPRSTLTAAQAKVEHKRLALEIEGHDRLYYQEDAPQISDAEYDTLRQRVKAIEARFPELAPIDRLTEKKAEAELDR